MAKKKRMDTVFYEVVPSYQEQPAIIDIDLSGDAAKTAAIKALKYLALGLLALTLQVLFVYYLVERVAALII